MLPLLWTGISGIALGEPSPAAAAQLLGVKLGALDRATVRLAYRRAAATAHPDVSSAEDASEQFASVTAAAEVLLRHTHSARPTEQTAAASRARWAEFWQAALSLRPLDSSLVENRVQLGELQERHGHVSDVSRQHAGAADTWPNSALTSALTMLLRHEAELTQAIKEKRDDVSELEEQREALLVRIAELQVQATGFQP